MTIPAMHVEKGTPICLRSYLSEEMYSQKITVWQAARATSAAPIYFDSIQLELYGKGSFIELVDGGLGFNNPGEKLLEEIKAIEDPSNDDFNPKTLIKLFLSLGTGLHEVVRLESTNIKERLSTQLRKPIPVVHGLEAITTSPLRTHRTIENALSSKERKYWRFDLDNGAQGVKMDDFTKIEQIIVDTDDYIDRHRVDRNACINTAVSLWSQRNSSEDVPEDLVLAQRFQDLNKYELITKASMLN
jgi:hypothetical protein